jgi:hypothetical protein
MVTRFCRSRLSLLATLALGVLASLLFVHSACAQERYRADAVKAAFLYRFAGYVEWPAEALDTEHFTIAVLGSSDVVSELQRLLPDREIKNIPARVRNVHRLKDVGTPHILYVSATHAENISLIIDALATKPILIVTDQAAGLDYGGSINFILTDRRVRFEISVSAAEKANLRIGAELLSVAMRVRGAPDRANSLCIACSCSAHGACLALASAP